MSQSEEVISRRGQGMLALAVVILSLNLRTPFTGVGALATMIRTDLGVSNTVVGLLTTIPMLVFAIVCPLITSISKRWGMGRSLSLGLWLMVAGEVVRSWLGTPGLFLGTALLSVGISFLNVLCIGLIKLRSAPERVGAITSAYTTALALGAALSIGVSVPLANVLGGWRGSLAFWICLTAVALVIWVPQQSNPENQTPPAEGGGTGYFRRLLRSPQAWFITLFMGTISLLFYSITAWLPSILESRGFTVEGAAVAATALQLISLPSTFLVPFLCARFRPGKMLACFNGCYLAGLLLFCAARSLLAHYAAIVLIAIGLGACMSFCILFYSLHTRTASEAAAVSGMAQSVGYLMAAVGPVLIGRMYDVTQSWALPLGFMVLTLVGLMVSGQLSARDRFVFE